MCLQRVSVDGPEKERTDVRIVGLTFLTSVVLRTLLDSQDRQRTSPSPSPQARPAVRWPSWLKGLSPTGEAWGMYSVSLLLLVL